MSIGRGSRGGPSWVARAGLLPLWRRQRWFITIGAVPFLWCLAKRDFYSPAFHAAAAMFVGVPVLTTLWAGVRARCRVCGLHIYGLWMLGFPRGERGAFDRLPCCPYCLDDGTGRTGDRRRVDHRREVRLAVQRGVGALLLFVLVAVAFVALALMGWMPGYERLPLSRTGPN